MFWLLMACGEPRTVEVSHTVETMDLHCSEGVAVLGHVDPAAVLSVAMCQTDLERREVCDLHPPTGAVTYWPAWGIVADCTEYGDDAWMRASYLIVR